MKLLRKATLYFKEGNSDKIYEVELSELSSPQPQRYIVNFRYGRRGGSLREGTKTTQPVDFAEAEEIFVSLVVSKENKGYRATAPVAPPVSSTYNLSDDDDQAQWQIRLLTLLESPDTDRRQRAIWRVGEIGLVAAHDKLLAFANQRDVPQIYCATWSLGRLRQAASVPLLQQLSQHGDERVRRIATDALMACLSSDERDACLSRLRATLPAVLQACVGQNDVGAWHNALSQSLGAGGEHVYLLESLYRLSLADRVLHQALCEYLSELPLKPPYFRVFRHILKSAEFHLDGILLGVIAKRLDTTPPMVPGRWIIHPHTHKMVEVSEELKKTDSTIAYSTATRAYLRRRMWRVCRRLGEIDDDRYVSLAAGFLRSINDSDAQPPFTRERYEWKQVNRRYQRVLKATKHYDEFARHIVFNHILGGNNPQYRLSHSGKAWEYDATQIEPKRGEAFPEIWDRHPQILLQLLLTSNSARVQRFGVHALECNDAFCKTINTGNLSDLLRSAYIDTSLFALQLAMPRLQANSPEWPLLIGMLDACNADVWQAALRWLDANTTEPPSEMIAPIWSALIANPGAPARQWLLQHLPWRQQLDLIAFLCELEQRLPTLAHPESTCMPDVITLACDTLRADSSLLALEWLQRLLFSDHPTLQLLGAELLTINQISLAQIPAALISRIHNAEAVNVRALGIRLLQKLDKDQLFAQAEALITALLSSHAEIRRAAWPLAESLAHHSSAFAWQCLQQIMGQLFQSESSEGLHDELLAFTRQSLKTASLQLDRGTQWRLLHARSRGAQRLGEWLLPQHPPTQWSVRQWAALGAHPTQTVREWVQQAYNDHLEFLRADKANALRLLGSTWSDAQTFALNYFSEHFESSDWSPNLLIYLVDHVEEHVQRFGRDLITRFFENDTGPEYLAKLSQHPSTQVQLFVSNFLQDHAGGHTDRILGLQHYFLTVLTQVNRCRVAKDRVLQFLAGESQRDAQVAALTLQLLTRLSATVALQDKARFLPVLLQLQRRYPELPVSLTVNFPPLKPLRVSTASMEKRDAV